MIFNAMARTSPRVREGQALVELMVAMGILLIGFLATARLLVQSFGINRTIEDDYRGTYLAEEGIEIVRSLVAYNILFGEGIPNDPLDDRDLTRGLSDGCYTVAFDTNFSVAGSEPQLVPGCAIGATPPLRFRSDEKTYSYDPAGSETPFRRMIRVTHTDDLSVGVVPYRIAVESTVSWSTHGGGQLDLTLEDYFYTIPTKLFP